jgi:hypothetical protein
MFVSWMLHFSVPVLPDQGLFLLFFLVREDQTAMLLSRLAHRNERAWIAKGRCHDKPE